MSDSPPTVRIPATNNERRAFSIARLRAARVAVTFEIDRVHTRHVGIVTVKNTTPAVSLRGRGLGAKADDVQLSLVALVPVFPAEDAPDGVRAQRVDAVIGGCAAGKQRRIAIDITDPRASDPGVVVVGRTDYSRKFAVDDSHGVSNRQMVMQLGALSYRMAGHRIEMLSGRAPEFTSQRDARTLPRDERFFEAAGIVPPVGLRLPADVKGHACQAYEDALRWDTPFYETLIDGVSTSAVTMDDRVAGDARNAVEMLAPRSQL